MRTLTGGRGRPREDFDHDKEASRLRETGAPYWFIHEWLDLKVSVSTLSRRLRGVKQGSKRPFSYRSTKFHEHPNSCKLQAKLRGA